MEHKKYRYILSVLFLAIIIVGGLATLALNPIKIAGGLARGYLSADADSSIFDKIENGFVTFEDRVNTYFVAHDASINTYGGIQKLMGRTHVDDPDSSYGVLKLKNGYLVFEPKNKAYDDTDHVEYVSELNNVCEKNDIDFLYVSKPAKGREASLYPDIYPVKGSDHTGETVSKLNENGVDTLDLTAKIEEEGLDLYDLFYIADHHWTTSTGLWGAREIATELNARYGYGLDTSLLDESLYEIEHYDSVYLGSQGRRVGQYFAGMDDFDILWPTFETSFDVEYYNADGNYSGDFSDVFLFRDQLNLERPLTLDTIDYDVYMQGNHELIQCHNHLANNDKKCLIMINSFGCVLCPFLSLEFSELDCIDVRSFTDQSIADYIEETQPDVVVYMLNRGEDQGVATWE